ncbi:unnamed protein product [Angiostrongylus costaricensis]|uniref:Rho-GAP domain-containing protein n=1 Tax=Angiostrongylus costaricensis TaxID=334426 RepID=A0A0R3PLW6_ANGCS|nr:unnamed protein product [Angiostrongylus costaricensis]
MVKSEVSELQYAPPKVTHRRITEIDSWLVWKNCLLARLRRALAVSHLPFITWEVLGQDVKWSCQRVGVSGIVKLRSDRDDFSSYLMRLMRYLEQFPFPSGSANIITYKDNQEVNVFRTVCSHLTREQPILTNAQASALLHVVSLSNAVLRSDLPHQRYGWPVHIETEFTENPPRSRIVPRQSSSGNSTTSTTDSTPSFTESLERFSFNGEDKLSQKTRTGLQPSQVNTSRHVESLVSLGTIAQPSRLGHERRNVFILGGVPKYNEILNLPGLKESPELLQRLNEMCLKLQPNSDLISQVSSEFIRLPEFNQLVFADHQCGISHLSRMSSHTSSLTLATNSFSEELLPRPPDHILEALSLLLLSLPSPRRRRLHFLIRFMNKISANHCLQLDDVHSNRYVALKGLSGSIISTQGASPLLTSQCSHLVSLLLDYEKEVFSVPKGLILEVDATIRERQRDKVTPIGQSPELRSEMADYVQFCEPAKGSEYEEQNLNLVDNLLELLDQICIDENLTVQVR